MQKLGYLFSLVLLQRSLGSAAASLPFDASDFVDLAGWPSIRIDLKYASTDNFTHQNVYGSYKRCLLHRLAADKFKKAVHWLAQHKPGWKIVVFDALRPRSAQWKLWNVVKDGPQKKYVADPKKGSMHNYGMALDLGLQDERGKLLDMGTGFDTFTELSQPKLETKFFKQGKLSAQQLQNRQILRQAMEGAGFQQLAHEWWHFDALPDKLVRAKYKIVE